MQLNVTVRDERGSEILSQTVTVPDDIPYPGDDRGPITLVGLKTAIDFYLSQDRRQ